MKKLLTLFLVLAFLFILGACGQDAPEEKEHKKTTPKQTTAPATAQTEPSVCSHQLEVVQTTDATCTEAGKTVSQCYLCGEEFTEEIPAHGHSFPSGNCANAPICTVCGAVSEEVFSHTFADATCTAPETCTVCGQTNGEARGHCYANGICIDCGTIRASEGLSFKFRDSSGGYYVAGIGSCTDTNIVVPNLYEGYPVLYIDNLAFQGNEQIESIVLPETVFSIGSGAFYECTNLKEVTLPESLIRMGDKAFYGCTSLTSIELPGAMVETGQCTFEKCTALTTVTISEGTTTISDCSFFGCTSLTTVNLPATLTQINRLAFYQCKALTSIVIPSAVTTVGNQAFGECTALTGVFTEMDAIPTGWDAEWCGTVGASVYLSGSWEYTDGTPTPKA